MIRAALVVLALLSPLLFPWPLVALLTLIAASVSSLIPLAVGIFVDALYYSRGAASFPWATVSGLAVTLAAFGVRRFLETSIMR